MSVFCPMAFPFLFTVLSNNKIKVQTPAFKSFQTYRTNALIVILPRSAEAELTAQVNSPVRPEGRTPAFEQSRGRMFQSFSGAGEAPPSSFAKATEDKSARAGELTSRSTPPLPLTAELVRHLSGLVSGSPCLRRPRRFALGTRPANVPVPGRGYQSNPVASRKARAIFSGRVGLRIAVSCRSGRTGRASCALSPESRVQGFSAAVADSAP